MSVEIETVFGETKSGRKFPAEGEMAPVEVEGSDDSPFQKIDCRCGCIYRTLRQSRLFYGGPLFRKIKVKNRARYSPLSKEEEANWAWLVATMKTPETFVGQVIDNPENLPAIIAEEKTEPEVSVEAEAKPEKKKKQKKAKSALGRLMLGN